MSRIPFPRDAVPQDVLDLCRELDQRGFRSWIVGGCVRDILRGGEAKDWDIATSARPEEVTRSFRRVIPTGVEHGTVTVLFRGGSYEVTTLRGEGDYSDGRRPDAVFFVDDIVRDLARRDFTVNAIAYDPVTESISDPFDGRADIDSETIRAVGDPLARFREDGLRVLRAARFCATLGFTLEPKTEEAISGGLDVFARVSAERVREEWVKALKAERPSRAFDVMARTGILAITFPEFALLRQGGAASPMDGNDFDASLRAADNHPGPWPARLAALLHSVGHALGSTGNDSVAAERGADVVNGWMKRYRFSNKERTTITHLIRYQGAPLSYPPSDEGARRYAHGVGLEFAPMIVTLALAISQARGDASHGEAILGFQQRLTRVLSVAPPLNAKALALTGGDIISLLARPGGRWVKEVQRDLLDVVLADPALNERSHLERLVADWGVENGDR